MLALGHRVLLVIRARCQSSEVLHLPLLQQDAWGLRWPSASLRLIRLTALNGYFLGLLLLLLGWVELQGLISVLHLHHLLCYAATRGNLHRWSFIITQCRIKPSLRSEKLARRLVSFGLLTGGSIASGLLIFERIDVFNRLDWLRRLLLLHDLLQVPKLRVIRNR